MKKYAVVLVTVLFIFASLVSLFANDIVWDDVGRGNLDLRTVLVNPHKDQIIYIGSNNAVFKSEDGAQTWRSILAVKGQNRAVNFLAFDVQDNNALYAATGSGLFYSDSQGKYWRRIFSGKNYLENDCAVMAALPYGIYLGTRAGLFISKDKGLSWHRPAGRVGKSQILAIAANKNVSDVVYIASNEGVFKSRDKGASWARIFTANLTENNHIQEEMPQEQEETRVSELRYLTLDPNNPDYLFLATSRGIYKSKDGGKSWEPFTSYGLLSDDIKFILISDRADLYAMTKSAIFGYKSERWQEISFGLASTDIRFIALDKRYNLYAACDKGLFKNTRQDDFRPGGDLISMYLENEPDIQRVQEVAIEYAEVHPDKIKAWRNQAARKAILPQFSVGVGRNVTDLWHWESGSTTRSDDDVLQRGHDALEWDITLSWDLSELIWNNDQTSIDSRSKLMAELRGNILDEVTRIYFERLRLKMELDSLKIEDRKKRFEKELRLRELAASLDALTGGYFSASLKSNHIGS